MAAILRRVARRVFGAFVAACLATPALAETRIALVIGNSAYETVSVLPNPANDARAMAELLQSAGFEVVSASNLTQTDLRRTLSDFAGKVAEKGPDTVALVFYAGHGVQVDGENFLVPVDARIARESDVPMQTVRLADVINVLSSVPSRMRIVILDACRNNPFSSISGTTGRGLAIVDAPTGSLVSYATAPGMVAYDGDGDHSPFTAALVEVAKETGLLIEQAFKRARLLVHQKTGGRQTPWESSSLIGDFSFFAGAGSAPQASADPAMSPAPSTALATARAQQTKTMQQWWAELDRMPADEALATVIREDVVKAYEAFLVLYGDTPGAGQVRSLLERRREMLAWHNAVTLNTVDAFQAFLDRYPGSDLAATARRLMERARLRSAVASAGSGAFALASAPSCSCSGPGQGGAAATPVPPLLGPVPLPEPAPAGMRQSLRTPAAAADDQPGVAPVDPRAVVVPVPGGRPKAGKGGSRVTTVDPAVTPRTPIVPPVRTPTVTVRTPTPTVRTPSVTVRTPTTPTVRIPTVTVRTPTTPAVRTPAVNVRTPTTPTARTPAVTVRTPNAVTVRPPTIAVPITPAMRTIAPRTPTVIR